jgi:uncharacterized membrane protein
LGSQPAVEWSGGQVIDLGGLPGSTSAAAESINDHGQVAGWSSGPTSGGYFSQATEWSGGQVIDLVGLPGGIYTWASGINDLGQVVGYSYSGLPTAHYLFLVFCL